VLLQHCAELPTPMSAHEVESVAEASLCNEGIQLLIKNHRPVRH